MNNKKILLNSKKSKTSSDKENSVSIDLNNNSRLLPIDNIDEKIDEYKQYLKEKEKSHKYRLSFTINPICTNILFNNISEILYKEGSVDCKYFGLNGTTISGLTDVKKYLTYKGLSETTSLNRIDLIRDTGFSHPDIGSFVYHCGYDIFNNHTLRKKEFSVINKLGDSLADNKKKGFNTISDFKRDCDGNIIQERIILSGYTNNIPTKWGNRDLHQYQVDTLYSFSDSITENLVEENGWVGFLNKTTLDIPNYGNISINKTMNNNKSGEFIDMYPDRSLYSFVPKVNKYRNNRLEPNWDYCLTYPYENFYNNSLVQYNDSVNKIKVNGLKCEIVGLSVSDNIYELEDGDLITLKTKIKNTFKKGSALQFEIIDGSTVEKVNTLVSVNNVIGKQDDGYYFEIYGEEVIEVLNHFDNPSSAEIRVRQVINGTECEYYFREFKKIPNYKNGSTIFNSSLNKLAYSKNIYNDDIVQLLYNDDIEIGDLRDNLGRELSEIYLTIVKNNKGYKTWYDLDDKIQQSYVDENISFSRCFGGVTSGVNILDINEYDYNIHKMHNVPTGVTNSVEISKKYYEKVGIYSDEEKENLIKELNLFENIFKYDGDDYSNPLTLENEISIENETFLGDIVEFSPSLVEETILENVYHRFNTVQREYYKNGNNEFVNLFTDEIMYDDFDIDNGGEFTLFDSGSSKYNAVYLNDGNEKEELMSAPVNISPEGYFYQAHYRVPLKEKRSKVNQGSHTRMTIVDYSEINGKTNEYNIRTNKNYYLEKGGTLYLYDVNTNEKNEATIISVGGKPFTEATIRFDKEIDNNGKLKYSFFKPNVEQPKNSYELTDGSGRYLWREYLNDNEYDKNSPISKYVFTNGAHYINKSINFFLRRQDPDGRYNLSNIKRGIVFIQNLVIDGYSTDNSNIEYNDSEIDGILC